MKQRKLMIGLVSLMGLIAHRADSQVPENGTNGNLHVYVATCPRCGELASSTEVHVNGGRTDGAGGNWVQRSTWFRSKCGNQFVGELPELHIPKIVVTEATVLKVVNRSQTIVEPPLPPLPMSIKERQLQFRNRR